MFAVVITEKGGAQRRTEFDKTEVTIGRVQGNDIILPKGNVSKRHSRIVLKDNRFIVVDLKSTNGTYVNGRKITSPLVVKSGDKIYIGDFILTLEEPGGAGAMAPAPVAAASPPMGMGGPPPLGGPAMGPPPMGGPPMGPPPMGPPPMGGPPPLGGPPVSQTLGGPGPMGPPPMGPPPMGPPPMGPPMGGPAMGPPMGGPPMGPPPMGDAPPMPTAPRPPSMRPPSLQPRASGPAGGAPPPLPRAPEPAEPPAMPPGADRFKLDEEPADADETMAPSPRLVAASRPRMDPPPAAAPAAPRVEPAAPAPAPARAEPPRQERAEPAPVRATPAAPLAAPQPIVVAAPPVAAPVTFAAPAERAVEPGPLGPFEALLEEVGVLEIVAEGPHRILVDRGNGLVGAGKGFASGDALAAAAARLFATGGSRLAHGRAVQEASLPDGSHVLAVLPPFAVGGPYVEVRRLGRPAAPGETLVGQGMLSNDMLSTLRSAVAVRRNVVVIGASDAGVPQLVAALVAMSPESDRVVCVESSPELALPAARAVRFSAGSDALGALIERAASLRSDRLVLDGVTGGHVRAALVALASRSGGGILGVRAPSIGPSIEQLASLASLGGTKDGAAALAASACHVIVRMSRGADGVRRIDAISELQGEGLVTLFEHDDGGFASTGARPSF